MNGSATRKVDEVSASWRLGRWPGDPNVAHLIFTDHSAPPRPSDVAAAIALAQRRGAHAVRTSAMFARAANVVADAGFCTIDRLLLLRSPLDARFDERRDRWLAASRSDRPVHDDAHEPALRSRPMRRWHRRAAAEVDIDAFGPMWGNDPDGLRDILHATPVHHARVIHRGRDMAGFAISGAASGDGYLQRLSVSTAHRRRGAGRELVFDSLTWMRRCGLATAFVNTGDTNEAALRLYEATGFTRTDDVLVIAERRLSE